MIEIREKKIERNFFKISERKRERQRERERKRERKRKIEDK